MYAKSSIRCCALKKKNFLRFDILTLFMGSHSVKWNQKEIGRRTTIKNLNFTYEMIDKKEFKII